MPGLAQPVHKGDNEIPHGMGYCLEVQDKQGVPSLEVTSQQQSHEYNLLLACRSVKWWPSTSSRSNGQGLVKRMHCLLILRLL